MLIGVFYLFITCLENHICVHQNRKIMVNKTKKATTRAYSKKTLVTQDELWKLIVPQLWNPLVHFFMEDWVDKIDFTKKPVFLDKELKRLQPRGKSKNRVVDILMRLHLKDGKTRKFLLHLEIQAYLDMLFPYRVYQYYYRITDYFQEPIETLVLLIDENPDFRPTEYHQVFGQTESYFKFRMFKLLDNSPPYIGKEDNPFSIVMEVAWYALKQNKLKTDEDLMALKFRLIRRLMAHKIEEKVIYALFDFINIYLPFKNSENTLTFEREIEPLVFKDSIMEATTIRDLYIQRVREQEQKNAQKAMKKLEARRQEEARMRQEEARMRQEEARMRQEEAHMRQEEARMRQESENKLRATIINLYTEGFSVEKISSLTAQPIEFIKDIVKPV